MPGTSLGGPSLKVQDRDTECGRGGWGLVSAAQATDSLGGASRDRGPPTGLPRTVVIQDWPPRVCSQRSQNGEGRWAREANLCLPLRCFVEAREHPLVSAAHSLSSPRDSIHSLHPPGRPGQGHILCQVVKNSGRAWA